MITSLVHVDTVQECYKNDTWGYTKNDTGAIPRMIHGVILRMIQGLYQE